MLRNSLFSGVFFASRAESSTPMTICSGTSMAVYFSVMPIDWINRLSDRALV